MSGPGVDHPFEKLLELMAKLRGPDGCPWDREQTHETLKPMLVEEAFEVLEALDGEDSDDLCEELGDLLFQVVFHSQIARENSEFDALEVCRRLHDKMVRRHPHVFGDESFSDSRELLRNWESLKNRRKEPADGKSPERSHSWTGFPTSFRLCTGPIRSPQRLPVLALTGPTSKALRTNCGRRSTSSMRLEDKGRTARSKRSWETFSSRPSISAVAWKSIRRRL